MSNVNSISKKRNDEVDSKENKKVIGRKRQHHEMKDVSNLLQENRSEGKKRRRKEVCNKESKQNENVKHQKLDSQMPKDASILSGIQTKYVPFIKEQITLFEKTSETKPDELKRMRDIYNSLTSADERKQIEAFKKHQKILEKWFNKALNKEDSDCIYLKEFRSEDKTKNQKETGKDLKKPVIRVKKKMTPEEAKRKAEQREKKHLENLLKKQELEARKHEREQKMVERRLLKDIENKAKEERKKERERKRLEKIEKEKEKQLKMREKEEESRRVFEAKLKMKSQMREKKMEETRKKKEEKKKAELERQAELLKAREAECKAHYDKLAALDDENLVPNSEPFECPICFTSINNGEGVILHDCLHSFCKDCLIGLVQHSETASVKCPFQNEEYFCESHLQDREVKSLVTPELYEKHLQRSVMLAESQAPDSFHCKTSDCSGWCLYEDNVNIFLCPVCAKSNCLTCAAIHEGKTCKEYQDYVAFNCNTNEEAKRTKEYLQDMVRRGEAMECPQCHIVIMKKYGCDFMTCTMCRTDICWVTKGRRWGPLGQGDTSGGCRCKVNGVPCHPNCRNCH